MSARSFQATTGVQHFFDQHDLGTRRMERTRTVSFMMLRRA